MSTPFVLRLRGGLPGAVCLDFFVDAAAAAGRWLFLWKKRRGREVQCLCFFPRFFRLSQLNAQFCFSKQRCAALVSKVCSFLAAPRRAGAPYMLYFRGYLVLGVRLKTVQQLRRRPRSKSSPDGSKAPKTAQQLRPRPRTAAVYLGEEPVYNHF